MLLPGSVRTRRLDTPGTHLPTEMPGLAFTVSTIPLGRSKAEFRPLCVWTPERRLREQSAIAKDGRCRSLAAERPLVQRHSPRLRKSLKFTGVTGLLAIRKSLSVFSHALYSHFIGRAAHFQKSTFPLTEKSKA